jgi:hypothetical protein
MLSGISMIGLPMVTNPILMIIVYLTPVGLLGLIMLLNKNY